LTGPEHDESAADGAELECSGVARGVNEEELGLIQ
jgi:hypothetical protein